MDKKLELIKNQAKFLSSSFDAVQIVVTRYDKETGSTETYAWGEGNFHARFGMLAAWVRDHEVPMMPEDDEEELG